MRKIFLVVILCLLGGLPIGKFLVAQDVAQAGSKDLAVLELGLKSTADNIRDIEVFKENLVLLKEVPKLLKNKDKKIRQEAEDLLDIMQIFMGLSFSNFELRNAFARFFSNLRAKR